MPDIKHVQINNQTRDIMPAVVDSTPTENSTNPVTSGGVYSALGSKQDTLIFDTTPTKNSTNPVTSGGVKSYSDTAIANEVTRANGAYYAKDSFYTDVVPDGLCHNNFYREKDITAAYTAGTVSTNIANGTFHDIFPGDRITLNSRTYVVGGLNTYLHKGSSDFSTNHILMFPLTTLGSAKMNSTNITTGGYVGSEMYTALHSTASGSYYATVSGDFGSSHLIQHPAILSNATVAVQGAMFYDEGYLARSSNWAWSMEYLSLMSEIQVYGSVAASSSLYDIGEGSEQIPAFRLNARLTYNRSFYWWLRGVASARRFCLVSDYGRAYYLTANTSSGVRPLFLIK